MKVVHPHGMRVATLGGHIINLEPNVPADLIPSLATLALGHGAQIVEHEDPVEPPADLPPPVHADVPHVVVKPVPETDHEKLVKIMKDIIARGSKEEFRADGEPKNAVLNRLFGRVVNEEMRNAAWTEATTVVEATEEVKPQE